MLKEAIRPQDLEELAKSLEEMIKAEGFDTYVREGLHEVADRLRELNDTHKPEILRDLRDLGWYVLQHNDIFGEATQWGGSPSARWMFHKPGTSFWSDGVVAEGRGSTDEDALWMVAARVARHELSSKKALAYANKLVNKGESFKKAIEAAKEKFKEGE